MAGRGGGHHLRSRSADLCLSPLAYLPARPAGFYASRGRHAIPSNRVNPALPVAASCQARSSQGPQHRKQETAAFLSSDEEHCHMATPPPPAAPGGSASNPSLWAVFTWSDGDAFNFPFLVGGRSRLCGHRLRNGRHSPPGPAAPSPPPSRPPFPPPFPPPPAASSPNAYPRRHFLSPPPSGWARNGQSFSEHPGRPSLALTSPWEDVIQSLGAWDVVRKPCGIPRKRSRVITAKAGQCNAAGRAGDRPGLSAVCGRRAGLNS